MMQFNFGINWQNFSEHALDPEKLTHAEQSLHTLIGQDLHNKTFLDIGSGSGIFSIAAARLGAQRVVGFDISKESVAAARKNTQRFAPDARVEFFQQSILDNAVFQLGAFDIVYSWGVLHHTGQMWKAIDNALALVADDGIGVIALYNKHWSSPIWEKIKYLYNISPKIVKRIFIYLSFCAFFVLKFLTTFKNPLRRDRGMNFYYDVIDWLGGYPYEYASRKEVIDYVTQKGFRCINCIPIEQRKGSKVLNTGCNEFVFQRTTA